MDSKSKLFKTFNLDRGDLWLDVMVPGNEGLSATDTLSFRISTVVEMQSLGEKNSLLKLEGGREIVLNLSHTDLRRRLREAEDTIVDLTAVTNLTPRKQLAAKLKEEFAEAVEREKNKAFNALTFRVFLRTSQKTDFREVTFTGADIKIPTLAQGGSIMGGNNTKFELREPAKFGYSSGEVIMEIDLADFKKLVEDAKQSGNTHLDLRALSMRKGVEIPPEKRKANGLTP